MLRKECGTEVKLEEAELKTLRFFLGGTRMERCLVRCLEVNQTEMVLEVAQRKI